MSEYPRCSVCLVVYDDKGGRPHVLPCGHSMCAGCLVQFSENPICPIDSEVFSVDTKYPVNFGLLSVLLSSKVEYPVIPVDTKAMCMHHNMPYHLFDSECNMLICRECMSLKHYGHKCRIILEAAADARKETPSILVKRSTEQIHTVEMIKEMETNLELLNANYASCQTEIQSTFVKYRELVDAEEAEHLTDLQDSMKQRTFAMEAYVAQLKQFHSVETLLLEELMQTDIDNDVQVLDSFARLQIHQTVVLKPFREFTSIHFTPLPMDTAKVGTLILCLQTALPNQLLKVIATSTVYDIYFFTACQRLANCNPENSTVDHTGHIQCILGKFNEYIPTMHLRKTLTIGILHVLKWMSASSIRSCIGVTVNITKFLLPNDSATVNVEIVDAWLQMIHAHFSAFPFDVEGLGLRDISKHMTKYTRLYGSNETVIEYSYKIWTLIAVNDSDARYIIELNPWSSFSLHLTDEPALYAVLNCTFHLFGLSRSFDNTEHLYHIIERIMLTCSKSERVQQVGVLTVAVFIRSASFYHQRGRLRFLTLTAHKLFPRNDIIRSHSKS